MSMFGDLPVDPDYDYPVADEFAEDPSLYQLQTLWGPEGSTPSYYPTGPMPGALSPTLDAYIQYLMATGAMPDVNSRGNPVPFGLDTQKSLLNYQQDLMSTLADPMNAYLSNSYAPGAFDPIRERTPIELVQTPVLQQLASSGGVQGMLASFMLPESMNGFGDNYLSAVARLRRGLNNPDELQLSESQVNEIRDQLPALSGMDNKPLDKSDPTNIDWQSLTKDAQQMWQPFAQEQAQISAPGVEQGEDGRYYTVTETDSPQTEWLRRMGLPDPAAQYDVQFALENDPAVRGAFSSRDSSAAALEAKRKTFEEYTKKIVKQRDQAAAAKRADAEKMDEYANAVRSAMGEYFANQGQQGSIRQMRGPEQGGALARYALGQVPGIDKARGLMPDIDVGSWADRARGLGGQIAGAAGNAAQNAAGALIPKPMQAAYQAADPVMTEFNQDFQNKLGIPQVDLGGLFGGGGGGDTDPMGLPDKPQQSIYSERPDLSADEIAGMFNEVQDQVFRMPLVNSLMRGKPRAARKADAKEFRGNVREAKEKNMAANRAYVHSLIPYMQLSAAGRTPRTDAIQQRILPAFTSGAWGQQGLPTAYPRMP